VAAPEAVVTLADWSEDELAANRRGELAATQVEKIRGRLRVVTIAAVVICALFLAFDTAFFLRDAGPSRVIGVVFGCFTIAMFGGGIGYIRRGLTADLRHGVVKPLEGIVAVSPRGTRDNKIRISIAGRGVRPLYTGLETRHGQVVTAYQLPGTGIVIAIEPVSAAPGAR
jgi:hypothetical protein